MITQIFYILNFLLLFSCVFILFLKSNKQLYSFSLIQILFCVPLLSGVYFYFAYNMVTDAVPLLVFSENIFALIWFYAIYRISRSARTEGREHLYSLFIQLFIGLILLIFAGYYSFFYIPARVSDTVFGFGYYGVIYCTTFILLLSIFAAAWNVEKLWHSIESIHRWGYKFFIIGSYLICGSVGWMASYRITYQKFIPNHFYLLAILLFTGWVFILYSVVRYRLLNRKMFISRKIIYSFIAPSIFAVYLIVLGIISIVMRSFDVSLPFVLQGLFLVMGIIFVGIFISSGQLRKRMHFFISTHFYVNKYEYRDEWLALSYLLQGALTEDQVILALRKVLFETLYTTNLYIWIGDAKQGYKTIYLHEKSLNNKKGINFLDSDDVLIRFLNKYPYFYIKEKESGSMWKEVDKNKNKFFESLNLVLIVPLFIGDQLVGLVGLGPEFTGSKYGQDDFDLLTAICTQTASMLLAVRMAEKLAHARERQAWDTLSAFVLHDVKNAATMLSLVRENAHEHIQNPEFQQDMLESVDDALKRMNKVQKSLSLLKSEIDPVWQILEITHFTNECSKHMEKRLEKIKISCFFDGKIFVRTDSELLSKILENLLLNAFEAGGDNVVIKINVLNNQAVVNIIDNGQGIAQNLLPDALFEPFATTKPKGTGIGLWQTKQLVVNLNGEINAKNIVEGGAVFEIRLPRAEEKK